jgi:hypothetical protein
MTGDLWQASLRTVTVLDGQPAEATKAQVRSRMSSRVPRNRIST